MLPLKGDLQRVHVDLGGNDRGAHGRTAPAAQVAARGPRRRTRATVIRSATELLAEGGYKNLTIDGVAGRAGVARTTVYRAWPTRTALALAVLEDHLGSAVAMPATDDPRADLRAVIAANVEFFAVNPMGLTLTALAVEVHDNPAERRALHDVFRPVRGAISRLFERMVADGHHLALSDHDLAIDLYAGTILFRVLIGGGPAGPELVDQLTDLLLPGHTEGNAGPS